VMGNTIVVIGACVLLALVIFLADTGLSSLFGAIKLLG
jgi:preprotein translocase subunit SecE